MLKTVKESVIIMNYTCILFVNYIIYFELLSRTNLLHQIGQVYVSYYDK